MTLREAVRAHVQSVGPVSAAHFYGVSAEVLAAWSDPAKVPLSAVETLCNARTGDLTVLPWEGKGKVTLLLPWYKTGHKTFIDKHLLCGHVGGAVYGPANTGV